MHDAKNSNTALTMQWLVVTGTQYLGEEGFVELMLTLEKNLGRGLYVTSHLEDLPSETPWLHQTGRVVDIQPENQAGYFVGDIAYVNGRPALLAGFGDPLASAPVTIIMHADNYDQLPPEML
jgi:hypothetical protein